MKTSIFVIADLHLSESSPGITEGFLLFLEKAQKEADTLYILGDLFDAWIGDDIIDPFHERIANKLFELSQTTACYFLAGNRDFLLGDVYAKKSGIQRIKAQSITLLHNQSRVLFMHGDILCTDDHQYQRYRKIVHNPLIQWIYKHLPKSLRLRFADKLREKSKQSNQIKSNRIMDVNQTTVDAVMTLNKIDYLIHGHTHRPGIHKISLEARDHFRLVLGDWQETGWYIALNENIQLIEFKWSDKKIVPIKIKAIDEH